MHSANLRVLILEPELNRIREYVSRVPHRATGGLLLGNRFTRSGIEFLVITHTTVGVPDERLPDESCANHPVYTAADAARSLAGPADSCFLGRWHAHPDGLNRPSSADLEWAMGILKDPSVPIDEIIHPIALASAEDVKLFPYIVNRDALTFQKLNWQAATQAEVDQVRRNDPVAAQPEKSFDSQIFSLQKTRDLLRDERESVAGLPGVQRCEVFEQGPAAVLEAEVTFGDDRLVLQIAAGTLYPVHAPTLRITLNGESRSFSSKVLRDWNSSCHIRDIVAEASNRLKPADADEVLPLPDVDEAEPRKREGALLRAAGYGVQMTVTDSGGVLLTATSPLLEQTHRRFYAIMSAQYPHEPPAVALAEAGTPIDEVSFEMLPELPEGFSMLRLIEKMVPAARQQRAQKLKSRARGPAPVTVFLYFFLFLAALTAGYAWSTGLHKEFRTTLQRFMSTMQGSGTPGVSTVAAPETPASPATTEAPMTLKTGDRVLVVLLDNGHNTNLTKDEAQWAVSTALPGVQVDVIIVDLQNPPGDVARVREAARDARGLVVFSYNAGANQSTFIDTLRGGLVPLGVVSMAQGDQEDALRVGVAFYRLADRPGGKSGAQRALLELRKDRRIEIGGS